MKDARKLYISLLLLAAVGLMTGSAMALVVPDGDFESIPLPDNSWEPIAIHTGINTPWVNTYSGGYAWILNNYYSGGAYPSTGLSGAQWVNIGYSYIHQSLTDTYVGGETYELSIWATTIYPSEQLWLFLTDGTSNDGLNGAAQLAVFGPIAVTQQGDPDIWEQHSAQYTATAVDAGKNIGIALWGSWLAFVDDVTLESLSNIEDGLISVWSLDENGGDTTADSFGTNHGSLLAGQGGGVVPAWEASGKFGSALDFDGVSSYVDCGGDASLKPASVSVSAWVKFDSYPYYGQVAGMAFDENLSESGYSLICDDNFIGGGDSISAWVTGADGDGNYFIASVAPPVGSWHHIALTYDGTTSKIYVNGVSSGTMTTETGALNYTYATTFKMGVHAAGHWWLPYTGLIDDVAVWDRALTQTDIDAIYNGGTGNPVASFISRPNPYNPSPRDEAVILPVDTSVSCLPPDTSPVYYDVLFGTDPGAMAKVKDKQVYAGDISYDPPGDLVKETTYYWQVNPYEPNLVSPNVPTIVTPGPIWRFGTLAVDAMIGHWKLDEISGTNANDETTKNHDGTLMPTGFTFDADSINGYDGTVNGALDFVGQDEYISLPALNPNSDSMTITAWVKADNAANDWTGIVFNRTATSANGISLTGTELRYHWNGANWDWSSGLYVPVGEWSFVAMVVDPDEAMLYVNGNSATNTASHTLEAFDTETRICHDNSGAGDVRFFDGGIDEVRIYNYALTNVEIAGVYGAPIITAQPQSIAVADGDPNTLTVSAVGNGGLTYQWYRNSIPLSNTGVYSGTTTATLDISSVGLTEEGRYRCDVTDVNGTAASSTATVLTERLLHHWTFDVDGSDSADSPLNGTLIGDPNIVAGKIDNTIEFYADEDDSVVFGGAGDIPVSIFDFSVSLWMNTTDPEVYGALISNQDWLNGGNVGWGLYDYNDGNMRWVISDGAGGRTDVIFPSPPLYDGQWHMITATNDRDGNASVYVDGAFSSAASMIGIPGTVDSIYPVTIGEDGPGNYPYAGKIDDVRIYSYVLTPAEVAAFYDEPSNPVPGNDDVRIPIDLGTEKLQWDGVTYPATYLVYLDPDRAKVESKDAGCEYITPSPLVVTTDDPGILTNRTTYYWRVYSTNTSTLAEAFGPTWHFTTIPVTDPSIYVDVSAAGANNGSSWADAFTQLQPALDATVPGDEMWVAEGTYKPSSDYGLSIGDRGKHFRMINDVIIYGGFATGGDVFANRDPNQYETIVSGDLNGDDDSGGDNSENCYHVFYHPIVANLDTTAVLDGFTITAGNANVSIWPDHTASGGGMLNNSSSPTVTNCRFTGNLAVFGYAGGGGMQNIGSNPIVTDCTFTGNSGGYGGGMDNETGSNPTVTGCTFSDNSGEYGGGICNWSNSNPEITDCAFSGNSATIDGGGMLNWSSSPAVTDCTFSGNSATVNGGGMLNNGSSPIVTNCMFIDNSAWNGGGMYNAASNPTMTNCVFSGNRTDWGGGIQSDNSNLVAIGCTFSSNSANDGNGGGLDLWNSSLTVRNCILWGNTASSNGDEISLRASSAVNVDYCDVQGGEAGIYDDLSGNTINWGSGNIDADPLFFDPTNPDPNERDYHLMSESPSIDTGDPGSDYANEPQANGNRINMGAYGNTDEASISSLDLDVDGVANPWEILWGLDPDDDDTDDDGLLDGFEVCYDGDCGSYDPYDPGTGLGGDLDADSDDTDGDTISDAWEVQYSDVASAIDETDTGDDPDGDGFTNLEEFLRNSVPNDIGSVPAPITYYVDIDAPGPTHDGSSWSDAFTDLHAALAIAHGDIIRVAQGTYKPAGPGGDRSVSYQLKNLVTVEGGYAGYGEADPDDRDISSYVTILSGDLNGDDGPDFANNSENSYHVVTSSYNDDTAVLDGFTITAGNADGSYPENRGGGMYNNRSNPKLNDCIFMENSAYEGGGMHNERSSPKLTDCTFIENSAREGGGLHNNKSGPGGTYSSPVLVDCSFIANSAEDAGGGMFSHAMGSSNYPVLINCAFIGNSIEPGGSGGAGFFNHAGSNATLVNCLFSGNSADPAGSSAMGGGILNLDTMTLTNCTFSNNSAYGVGGMATLATAALNNCIFWGNSEQGGSGELAQITDSGGLTIDYSCVQGWSGALGGSGNTGSDPDFVDADGPDNIAGTIDDDLRLDDDSPCVDAADSSAVPADVADLDGDLNTAEPTPFDLLGNLRFRDNTTVADTGTGGSPIVDMGAYEGGTVRYVDIDAPGANNGASWDDAFTDLHDALAAAQYGDFMRVAQGTYKPAGPGGNRSISYSLKTGVLVRGGYAGYGEVGPDDRDIINYVTRLSGDLNDDDSSGGDNSENSYHVVVGSGTNSHTILDGFTISGGNANGAPPEDRGGGMFNDAGAPRVVNCVFEDNATTGNGGGMFNTLGNPTIEDCIFTQNNAKWGGGICNYYSNPIVRDCEFIRNTATDNSGALDNNQSSPVITGCRFMANVATTGHGGVMFNYDNSNPIMVNCAFIGNRAVHGGAYSHMLSSTSQATNCTLLNNIATVRGGAINNVGGAVTVTNSIAWFNTASDGSQFSQSESATLSVSYSNVQGGKDAIDSLASTIIWPLTNIYVDPNVTPDGHLRADSPCIDAATASGAPSTDFDGESRPVGSGYDIGADELKDTNANGLPDYWEARYPTATNPGDDTDGDTIINLEEFELYSSNPTATPYPVPLFPTIQAAIDAAGDGDTVLVDSDTYSGPGNRGLDFGGKSILLVARNNAGVTMIDCLGLDRAIDFGSGETASAAVIGFTIINGQADYGGAIRCDRSSPQIRECTIADSTATILGGGIYAIRAVVTIAESSVLSNEPNGIHTVDSGAHVQGDLNLNGNNWTGNNTRITGRGTIVLRNDAILDVDNSSLRCNIRGVFDIIVARESELVIGGSAVIDLGDPEDPNNNGTIDSEGLLVIEDNAVIRNANIIATRASFEDNVVIEESVIEIDNLAPPGAFFVDNNAKFINNEIHATGDTFLHIDPNAFQGLIANNLIYLTFLAVPEGSEPELLELRGNPDFANPVCDPDYFFCQLDNIPEFDSSSWTIEELILEPGAMVNLTNVIDYGNGSPGGYDEVIYVKKLVLAADSVLNTAYNKMYYNELFGDPNSTVNVPMLGYSLVNIAMDSDVEFAVRVTHNSLIHESNPDYNRDHAVRVIDESPDTKGMMRMKNLYDTDPDSSTYEDLINARAKGLFARTREEKVLILFEYAFEIAGPGVELVIYLSDKPGLLDHGNPDRDQHYLEVGRILPPIDGQAGSVDSGRFGTFHEYVDTGDLDFIRGTLMELELIGPEGTRMLIDDWDPQSSCNDIYCGDITIDSEANAKDFLTVLGSYGRTVDLGTDPGTSTACMDGLFSSDGYIDIYDAMSWDWALDNDVPLTLCNVFLDSSTTATTVGEPDSVPLGFTTPQGSLLVAGKRNTNIDSDKMKDALYAFDDLGQYVAMDLLTKRTNGKLVKAPDGTLYQINLNEGLLDIADSNSVIVPPTLVPIPIVKEDEPRYHLPATVTIGVQVDGNKLYGRPIFDAAFDQSGFVYVVPVVVTPNDANNISYTAAAKLELIPEQVPPYNLIRLYDDPNAASPNDNRNLNMLREIETDDNGKLYVTSGQLYNESDILWKYDSLTGQMERRLVLNDEPNLPAPIGLHVSSSTDRVYLASGQRDPESDSVTVKGFSTNDLTLARIITINGMGHVTDIAEDPATGSLWVVGFKMPSIPEYLGDDADPFYEPSLAEVPCGNGNDNVTVDAFDIAATSPDLAMPLSIIWTGDSEAPWCDGADIDHSTTVDIIDFGFISTQWQDSPDVPSADIAPKPITDDHVGILDLIVVAEHWLDIGCSNP